MKWIFRFVLMCGLLSLSFSAMSFNLDFLHDSTVKHFDDEDWKMVNAAADKALAAPNGERIVWHNTKTGHGGFVQAVNTSNEHGRSCRKIRIFNRAVT